MWYSRTDNLLRAELGSKMRRRFWRWRRSNQIVWWTLMLVLLVMIVARTIRGSCRESGGCIAPGDSTSQAYGMISNDEAQEMLTSLLLKQARKREIILTMITNELETMVLNYVCSLNTTKIRNYAIGALDKEVYGKLLARDLPVFPAFALDAVGGDVETGYFDTRNYHRAVKCKEIIVLEVLQRGYKIFYTDADVVFLRDPREFIRSTYVGYDFAFQAENKVVSESYILNAGVFHVWPTVAAKKVLQMTIDALNADPDGRDQIFLQDLLCLESNRKSNVTFTDPVTGANIIILEPSKFIDGHSISKRQIIFLNNLAEWKPNTVHFTCSGEVKGTKQARMMLTGFWFLDSENKCRK